MRVFDNPVKIGWLATLTIFGIAIWAGFSEYCVESGCTNKFAVLSDSRPNEIGDTLAGFAGALAFVWIIVTVALQSKELAAQREELQLTRKAMEEQHKATEKLAAEAGKQSSTLAEQFERSEKLQNDEFVKELLKDAFLIVQSLKYLEWYRDNTQETAHPLKLNATFLDTDSWDVKLLAAANAFDNVDRIQWRCNSGEIIPNSQRDSEVVRLVEILDQVFVKEKSLSAIFLLKLRRARFEEFHQSARVLAEDPSFWYAPEKTEMQ